MENILQITAEMLKEWQSWPLEMKIKKSKQTILDWYKHHNGNVCVSFSGGKDSTVLLHLVRTTIKEAYPDAEPVEAVFSNTGLEFPEIVEFVKRQENVTIVRPKMTYLDVIKKYGYALISKQQAHYIEQARNTKSERTYNLRMNGGRNGKSYKISERYKYLIKAPFKISAKCCDKLKKEPMDTFQKISKKYPYVGIMAGESRLRLNSYIRYGCNAFNAKRPSSRPLGHWLEQDIWDYIGAFGLEISEIYSKGYKRTGCMWCAFGAHLETDKENRFQKLQKTHPKIWSYCMDKMGLRKVLEYIGVDVGSEVDFFRKFDQ